MTDPLAPLLADGVIDEIAGRLKSGKEADLWLVRHRGELIAAKVYKSRQTRSFRNDAVYKEGRQVRNTRTQRAMDRGSRFGQQAAEDAWKVKEADALHALHAAGVRVPRPVIYYEGVLLMEVVVDAHGRPAPRLIDAVVPRDQAAALYADLRSQAVRMLCCDLVHGDLSPYNVLMGHAGPVVIDFPQVIGAAHNRQAERFFERDVQNLRRFFADLDPSLQAASGDAREIWQAYERRELTPDFVPTGRAPQRPAPHGGQRPEPQRSEGQRGPRGPAGPPRHPPASRHGAPAPATTSHREPRGAPGPSRHAAPAAPAARPARAGGDRGRRVPPSPEIVRVVRPPLGTPPSHHPPRGPQAAAPSTGHPRPAPGGAPHAEGAGGAGGRSGRRRRRRRGR